MSKFNGSAYMKINIKSKTAKTATQKQAINRTRNGYLRGVRSLSPGFGCQGSVGEFFDVYLLAEVFARKLQMYYRTDVSSDAKDYNVNLNTLEAALRHFNMSFDKNELRLLFSGGHGKAGQKSARQLRNGYVHSLSKSNCQEIEKNAARFVSSLNSFSRLRVR